MPVQLLVAESLSDLVGNTPLVRLRQFDMSHPADDPETRRATIWAKCEHLEPSGSMLDRWAHEVVAAAVAEGRLNAQTTLVEATSGNTGIALATVCAPLGIACVFAMPASMSLERRQLLEALGAKVVLTEPELQMSGAIARCGELAEELHQTGRRTFLPGQFENRGNLIYQRVVEEITRTLVDAGVHHVDAIVCGLGTGATATGLAQAIRGMDPSQVQMFPSQVSPCLMVGVEPARCATVSQGEVGPTKIQGLGVGFVPKALNRDLLDQVSTCDDDDAWKTMRLLARREGLLVGVSAGAVVFAAHQIARQLGPGKNIVSILHDTGERYFSLASQFAHLPEPQDRWQPS